MINLLPESERKAVRREYLFRLSLVALLLSSFCFLAGGAALLPSYVLSQAKKRSLEGQAAVAQRSAQLTTSAGADKELSTLREQLSFLSSNLRMGVPTQMLFRVLEEAGEHIALSRFSFAESPNDGVTLTLSGTAESRESLVAVSQALKKDPRFAQTNLPVSNLAKSTSVPFTMTIIISKDKRSQSTP